MDKLPTRAQSEVSAELGGQTLLERFERYSRLADAIAAFGLVGFVFASVTHWKNYIPSLDQQLSAAAWVQAVSRFFAENGWPPALAIVAIISHVAGRIFARKNIEHLRSMFADENTPTGFQIVSRWQLFLMINFQLAMAIFMVLFSRFVAIPAACWMLLHGMYLLSNSKQRAETKRIFGNPKYAPREGHPHKPFIIIRREAARRYLRRPHDAREYLVIFCALFAIGFWVAQASLGFAFGETLAYSVIIAGVLVNEVIVGLWRYELEKELSAANIAQLVSDRARDL